MKKRMYCLRRAAALLLALTATLSCMNVSASALNLRGMAANITDTTGASLRSLIGTPTVNVGDNTSGFSMMEKQDAGIYWIGCFRDVYQALNLQYDSVTSGLVLDPMNFERNELWILKPVSPNSVYFNLSPLSHPDYFIAGQRNDTQLRLSKTSSSNYAVQWAAIPDGDGDRNVLVCRQNGLAIDTAHGFSTTANKVLNYTRNGYQDAQSWSLIRVSESTTGWYPGVRSTIADGAYGILSAGNPSKCANDQFASTAGDGSAKICLDTWNKEPHETFVFINRGAGRYTISPSHATHLCLNTWGADPHAGNQITLATYRAGDECSLWEIYQQNGYYSFRNVKTGLWLNLWCNTHTDGQKIVGYYYDGTNAMKWKLQSVNSASNSAAAQSGSGYAAYTGVNYRSLTSDARRIAACDEAVQMATVLWKSSCSFPTWKSKSGSYNTVTATDGTSSTKFLAGKTYQGIPYSMAGRTYDDSKWLSLVRNGLSTGTMTGKYYTSRADTTARGIDCSYLVCQALNTGCGTSVNLNTSGMLNSSKFRKIALSRMLPGDIFLKNGHVMFFMGKTASGRYAIIEANAAYSRVVYRELSSSGISGYGCYRYTGFC